MICVVAATQHVYPSQSTAAETNENLLDASTLEDRLLMANMTTPAEPEKYEVLETIGRPQALLTLITNSTVNNVTGRGSFGTIRRVRRISDGHVYEPLNPVQILLETDKRSRYYVGKRSSMSRCLRKSESSFMPNSRSLTP